MHNVTHKVEGTTLIIKVEVGVAALNAAPPSSSGKTMLVGTTGGQVSISSPAGWAVGFALNVMAKKQ
jgi:hypothetical protein